VLDLHSCRRSPRSQLVLDALQTLADQLGIALHNAQLYAQALNAKAAAERASMLKSRLLANVSHELRTPLNIILGYSEAALEAPNPDGVRLPPELVQDLQHIQRSGQHLGRLIDDLLNLSQAEIGALEVYPEQVDVRALLADAFAAMAGSNTHARVEWRLQLPDMLPVLWADPVRLRQVLLNLLSNAARFTDEGHITLRANHGSDELFIWVEDTGIGVDIRTDHGAGLGLQAAGHLVGLHRGTLAVHSPPGCGTIFEVRLPLCAGSSTAPPSSAENRAPESGELALHSCLQRATTLSRMLAAFVAENYAAPVSREEISAALKVSPNHLSRVFRRDTGLTPWQYLSQYRILQAQKLLLGSELTVTEVAQRVGFSDPAYFVRVFHKETGRAPLQYRKSAK
jgi:AraC-like DNA-binding protein/nitrogen-specific signal transduction histidine kinase